MSDRVRVLELLVSLKKTGSFSATAQMFRLSSTSVPRFLSNHGAVLLELARRGGGAAVLDDYLVRRDIEQGRLVRLLPEISISSSARPGGLYVAILDSMVIPAKIRVFLDFLTARLAGGQKRFQVENTWERS